MPVTGDIQWVQNREYQNCYNYEQEYEISQYVFIKPAAIIKINILWAEPYFSIEPTLLLTMIKP